MLPDGFFDIHCGLDREGPGRPEDVHWAVSQIAPPARVLDAGCGPGADTVTLAEALPNAQIEALDGVDSFVADAQARTARFGARVSVRNGDMAAVTGPYDLIWCAGALYFLGVTQALTTWRQALSQTGVIAFSEPCLAAGASAAARAFWDGEGEVGDAASIRARVAAAGYEVLGERPIVGAAWEAYYAPMEARMADLTASGRAAHIPDAMAQAQDEIAKWRAAADEIAYLLMVVRRV